jgi:hypothetical protein
MFAVAQGNRPPASFERARAELARRLRERREEIGQAVMTRAFAVSDTGEPLDLSSLDPTYLDGLRRSIAAAVDFGLEVIERGEEGSPPPPPPILLTQARLAARYGVGLDTVLRRYSAGFLVLSDYLVEEAERGGLRPEALRRIMRAQAALDRILAAVSEEYAREQRERPTSSEERRAELIERLLAGEILDTSSLGYEMACTHLAAIATGGGVREALRSLASALQCRLLMVEREGALWAWLGSREPLELCELKRRAEGSWPKEARVAVGEPGAGFEGWCLSHRQAKAALPLALRGADAFVHYAEVALVVAVLKDDLLAASLRKLYLEPLKAERDAGEVLRETLRAYFAAGRNVSSAAASLGVNRNTVASRLRAVEVAIGRPLSRCGPEIDVALRLAAWDEPSSPPTQASS